MSNRATGFTFIEIVITVGLIGMLSIIAIPHYLHARQNSHRTSCMANMKKIQGAKMLYAFNGGNKLTLTLDDLMPFLKSRPACPSGGDYTGWDTDDYIYCTRHDWRNDPEYEGFVP